MRMFFKIFRIAAFPLAVVIFAIAMLVNPKYEQINMVDSMAVAVGSGTVEDGCYLNDALGISTGKLNDENLSWVVSEYNVKPYVETHKYLFPSIEHGLVKITDSKGIMLAELKTEYIDSKKVRNLDKAGEEYCRQKMGELKGDKLRVHRDKFSRYCTFTDVSEIKAGKNTFHAFLCEDTFWDTKTVVYCRRHGDFGFTIRFITRGIGDGNDLDRALITEVLTNIRFSKPGLEYVMFNYGN